jgi:hypothetical protein
LQLKHQIALIPTKKNGATLPTLSRCIDHDKLAAMVAAIKGKQAAYEQCYTVPVIVPQWSHVTEHQETERDSLNKSKAIFKLLSDIS